MHGVLPTRVGRSIEASAQTGTGISSPAQTGSDWFPLAARAFLGSDPGFNLHLLTGVPERTCYRYASGERDVTEPIVRHLLRSEQGWQWLSALMEGSDADWWRDIQNARLDSVLLRKLVDEITNRE